MNITFNNENKIKLDNLKAGDCFTSKGNVYLKTNCGDTRGTECVNLRTGELIFFSDAVYVVKFNCTLIENND